jgi:hypothetical protein
MTAAAAIPPAIRGETFKCVGRGHAWAGWVGRVRGRDGSERDG